MDPTIGRIAVNIGMLLVVLSAISLVLVDTSSFEFLLAVVSLVISVGFLVAVSYDIRREAKMATG